jgi:hypothetical protein
VKLAWRVIAASRANQEREMEVQSKQDFLSNQVQSHASSIGDWRLERVIDRLPRRFRSSIRWLRQPSALWIRMPVGALLTCGGVLGFLPVLGFWMLPIGLVLLADDVPLLRSVRSQMLDWIEHRHPQWLLP